jgi:myo-inositol-1-phosphate synthase
VVVIWCASTETFLEPGPAHQDLDALEAAMDANDQSVPPSMLYAYAALKEGVSFYGEIHHKVSINYYPPRGDSKEGWDNIGIFGWLGYPMQIKVDFLCRDSILAAPLALDLVLFMDLAQRAGLKGVQEWLSFYFKSPQHARGGYPEHDLFIQQAELKSMLRSLMGEEHLGMEYHQD